jgi:uncharacterized alkaline shock family protein YloU
MNRRYLKERQASKENNERCRKNDTTKGIIITYDKAVKIDMYISLFLHNVTSFGFGK